MKTSKQSIRRKYLDIRDAMTASERNEKSRKIWENLKKECCFSEAEIVLVYMDYRSEVITTGLTDELLMPENNKRIYAPKVEGLDISFYAITSLEELEPGYQEIREPVGEKDKIFTEELAKDKKCLLLVPGAVFDRKLGRMGYGKGFYDRFIHKFEGITSVGLAFDCQIIKSVPVENHDMRLDLIITESEIIKKL